DWGYGGAAQAAVTRRMCAEHGRRPLAFVLTTGDNFYRPDGVATEDNYGVPERCLREAGVPWRAAWGNHDEAGDSTATVLGAPRRYTFAAGPLRVVVLDSNRPDDPAQRRFLRDALAAAREPVRVVAFHHPAYTAGANPPGEVQRRDWVPLFRRHGVALVLQGHNHAYERMEVDGVTYITTGGGGAPVYPCVRPSPGLRTCLPEHHFLLVEARRDGLSVRAVTPGGRVLERVGVPARTAAAGGTATTPRP
ncbi:MAG TPA: metallophosphoesterase, partial [Miltoncostaeaceae bacterium]|nr:metallophosphoesterase [Miltoncostaeaceae bacterium]